MKNLRIGLLLMFLVLAGAWLFATESIELENEQPVPTLQNAQADTMRMTWQMFSLNDYPHGTFSFYGEEGATYKVDWGDGETDTYTGKGEKTDVGCYHAYEKNGTYTVLLYGVIKDE